MVKLHKEAVRQHQAGARPGTGSGCEDGSTSNDPRDSRQTRVTRRVSTVLVLGFVVRLLVAPWTASVIDDAVWYRAAANGMHGVGIYARLQFSYPPVWGYLVQGVGWVLLHVG